MDSIIANQFHKDYCPNFKLKINKLYKYNMLEEIVKNIIPNCELEITGLVFYPFKSGISYIQGRQLPFTHLNFISFLTITKIGEIKD